MGRVFWGATNLAVACPRLCQPWQCAVEALERRALALPPPHQWLLTPVSVICKIFRVRRNGLGGLFSALLLCIAMAPISSFWIQLWHTVGREEVPWGHWTARQRAVSFYKREEESVKEVWPKEQFSKLPADYSAKAAFPNFNFTLRWDLHLPSYTCQRVCSTELVLQNSACIAWIKTKQSIIKSMQRSRCACVLF